MTIDYYNLLNIDRNANKREIKNAYKKMALRYHPDRNPEGKETFQMVSDAYHILSDDILRNQYDLKQEFDFKSHNPFDTWLNLFPQDVSSELINKIMKKMFHLDIKDEEFDFIYNQIIDKLKDFTYTDKDIKTTLKKNDNENSKKNTSSAQTDSNNIIQKHLTVQATYELEELFKDQFKKEIVIELNKNNIQKKWTYKVDIRKPIHHFKDIYHFEKTTLHMNIDIVLSPSDLPDSFELS